MAQRQIVTAALASSTGLSIAPPETSPDDDIIIVQPSDYPQQPTLLVPGSNQYLQAAPGPPSASHILQHPSRSRGFAAAAPIEHLQRLRPDWIRRSQPLQLPPPQPQPLGRSRLSLSPSILGSCSVDDITVRSSRTSPHATAAAAASSISHSSSAGMLILPSVTSSDVSGAEMSTVSSLSDSLSTLASLPPPLSPSPGAVDAYACPICLDTVACAHVLDCPSGAGHVYCGTCISKEHAHRTAEGKEMMCPLCRVGVSKAVPCRILDVAIAAATPDDRRPDLDKRVADWRAGRKEEQWGCLGGVIDFNKEEEDQERRRRGWMSGLFMRARERYSTVNTEEVIMGVAGVGLLVIMLFAPRR